MDAQPAADDALALGVHRAHGAAIIAGRGLEDRPQRLLQFTDGFRFLLAQFLEGGAVGHRGCILHFEAPSKSGRDQAAARSDTAIDL